MGSDLVEYSLIFYMKEDTLNRVKRSIDFLSIPLVFILYSKILSSSHFAGKCSTDLEEEVVRVAVSIGHPLNDFDPVVHALQHAGVQPVEGTGNDTLHIWLQLLGKSYQSINSATEGHAGPFPPGASGRRLAFRKP